MCGRWVIVAAVLLGGPSAEARAQPRPTGHVSLLFDYLPNRSGTIELRTRIFAEEKLERASRIKLHLSGFVEGLLARRPAPFESPDVRPVLRTNTGAIARVQDAFVELTAGRLDLLAGFARVAWGRLDELQPTDVVNPLDVSRFIFEGRSDARLPVALVRGRIFLDDAASIEGVYVPAFRRGRFDQLDEPTSPFNIASAGSRLPFF
jgi:hypothetical protein